MILNGAWILGALFVWGAYKLACWIGERPTDRTVGGESNG